MWCSFARVQKAASLPPWEVDSRGLCADERCTCVAPAPLRLGPCIAGSSDVCVEVCRLRVYPQMDNGSKCERCGLAHSSVWQQARFASIDLVWSKGYNAGSALMGTTQSQMGQITQAVLLSEGFNVSLPHAGVPHRFPAVSGSLSHVTGHCGRSSASGLFNLPARCQ